MLSLVSAARPSQGTHGRATRRGKVLHPSRYGRVAAHSDEAQARQAETQRQLHAARRAWQPPGGPPPFSFYDDPSPSKNTTPVLRLGVKMSGVRVPRPCCLCKGGAFVPPPMPKGLRRRHGKTGPGAVSPATGRKDPASFASARYLEFHEELQVKIPSLPTPYRKDWATRPCVEVKEPRRKSLAHHSLHVRIGFTKPSRATATSRSRAIMDAQAWASHGECGFGL